MVNGKAGGLSSQVKHARDSDPESFNDPSGWNRASYSAHPIDSIELLSDEPNGYRQAALHHSELMYAIDRFIEAAPDARLAVVAVAVVLGWPSTRGLTVPEIAEQLGVSTSTIARACARFREMAGLGSVGRRRLATAGDEATGLDCVSMISAAGQAIIWGRVYTIHRPAALFEYLRAFVACCHRVLYRRDPTGLPPLRVDLPSREVRKVTAVNCSTRFNTVSLTLVE